MTGDPNPGEAPAREAGPDALAPGEPHAAPGGLATAPPVGPATGTPPAGPATETVEPPAERRLLVAWYGGLLGGILPILLLGFLYSALADRLVFVGWALALAAVYTIVLRQGLAWGWRAPVLAGLLGLLLAGGFGWLAGIESAHHEILDLGFRAVFPGFYHPLATRPASAAALAGGLAIAGVASLALAAWPRRSGGRAA
jgi:hypothetical protein